MHGLLSTHSIPYDTYSPKLTREHVNSGTLFLLFNSHVYTVKELESHGLPILYSSTVPKKVRSLEIDVQLGMPDEDEYRFGLSNFRNWRWPEHLFYSSSRLKQINISSMEQYEIHEKIEEDSEDFERVISKILSIGGEEEKLEDKLNRYINELVKSIKERVEVVQAGYNYYVSVGRRNLTSREHYIHSTPSRDERLFKSASKISELNQIFLEEEGKDFVKEILTPIKILIKSGLNLSAYDIYYGILENGYDFSSNPQDTIEERWGVQNEQIN